MVVMAFAAHLHSGNIPGRPHGESSATVVIVLANKEMFFETEHIGKLPEYKQKL